MWPAMVTASSKLGVVVLQAVEGSPVLNPIGPGSRRGGGSVSSPSTDSTPRRKHTERTRRLRILAAAVMSLIRVRSENTDLEGLAHLIQLAMFVLRVRIYVYIYIYFFFFGPLKEQLV